MLLLAYVDDILLSCEDTDLMYEMVEKLGAEKSGMDPGYLDDVMEEYNLKGAKGAK